MSGLEVVAVHRVTGNVVALDGDNSDGVNDGIVFTGLDGYTFTGIEGTDWDVLWTYDMGGYDNHGSAAIGDVDNDGTLEVVVGGEAGNVYVLNGATGALETTFTTGSVQASPALANIDSDPRIEIVIGDLGGTLYAFDWDGTSATVQSSVSLGSAIYSSAAIGNIDSDSGLEIVVGTDGGKVYALDAALNQEWVYPSTGSAGTFYASPSLADTTSVSPYDVEWQMFRHDAMRTGYYGSSANALDVVIGSMDGYLYLLNGNDGTMIDRFQTSGPIHGSPTIGDVDGDGKLNIIFQSWGGYAPPASTTYDRLWNVEMTSVPTNTPPVANPGVPYAGNEGSAITFDGLASYDPDIGDSIVSYEWDIDNDGVFESSGVSVSKTWPDDYSGTVSLKVTDTNGASDTASTTVTVNNVAPVVNAGPDQTVYSGGTVYFSGSLSDPGTSDTHTIIWNFGDGNSATGTLNPSHMYNLVPNTYTVTLTVTDDDGGIGSDTLTVTVIPIPVTIDIKPGSFPNSINLGNEGTVPVAILSSAAFDATTVNPLTVTLASAPVKLKGKGTPMSSREDVNGDGLFDLVVHVSTATLVLSQNDVTADLEGQTYDGKYIQGADSVRIVQP